MMNDPNFTEVMAYISSSFSPLVNINRRVVHLESPQTRQGLFSFDDVGNVDYTGIEPKYTLNQSEFIWDSDLSKSNRFPHFPARQPALSRRQEGKEEKMKKYAEHTNHKQEAIPGQEEKDQAGKEGKGLEEECGA